MTEIEKVEFGGFLRRLRQDARLSIRKASELIEISNPYLCQIERGLRPVPSTKYLRKMAIVYKVSYASILSQAKLDDPTENTGYFDDDALERATEFVLKDKRFKHGTTVNPEELTKETRRFIVEVYQRFTGLKLL